MITTKEELILDFIKQYRDLGATNCFSNGMCYWFAEILRSRFHAEHCHMMYDPVMNHYGMEINNRIYDISGDVTESSYTWHLWYDIVKDDPLLTARLKRDCIYKIPNGVQICGDCALLDCSLNRNLTCSVNNKEHTENDICEFNKEI